MKKRNVSLSATQKRDAKSGVFRSVTNSFKTEGVVFSPDQIKTLKSRLRLSK